MSQDQPTKPKIAVFSLTSCEGCSLQILNCEDEFLDLLAHVDVVNFREAVDDRRDDYDVAFVDGAVSTEHDRAEIQRIRTQARLLVAIGACACTGGLNVLKNFQDPRQVRQRVYGQNADWLDTIDAQPIDAVVTVDIKIPGCPIPKAEFLEVVKALLMGRKPPIPDVPVCSQCKLRETVCMFHKGQICLGPIARAGCEAICPAYGGRCVACRGLISDPNAAASKEVLAEHGLTVEDLLEEFRLYNGYYDVAKTVEGT
jgi:sulfhydrogenase subunit delta